MRSIPELLSVLQRRDSHLHSFGACVRQLQQSVDTLYHAAIIRMATSFMDISWLGVVVQRFLSGVRTPRSIYCYAKPGVHKRCQLLKMTLLVAENLVRRVGTFKLCSLSSSFPPQIIARNARAVHFLAQQRAASTVYDRFEPH